MVNNCKLYNDDTSTYMACAISLEKCYQHYLIYNII